MAIKSFLSEGGFSVGSVGSTPIEVIDSSGNITAGTITANLTGNVSGNAATATALATGRTIAITGDLAYTSPSFDGTGNVTAAGTLATVATPGSTGSSTAIPIITINEKGLTTSISTAAVVAPAGTLSGNTLASGVTASSLTSLGTIANLTATAGTIATTPTASTDIANKLYVDTVAQGLDAKASCLAATTANITLSGTQTIDDVSVIAGNRVLVKDQTAPEDNGIYLCAAAAWTRTTDAETWDELTSAFTFIERGTVNADTGYVCTANAGGTLGTTALPWSQFSGAGTFTAGTGLTLTGSVFSLTSPVAVANGGTGLTSLGSGVATFLGTPSSANLAAAVSDETGSGALVFATSPTLVAPALGTPASGVVTNLTGTASININGTVGATTPSTGAFTTLSATGVINASSAGVQALAGVAWAESAFNNNRSSYLAQSSTLNPGAHVVTTSGLPSQGIMSSSSARGSLTALTPTQSLDGLLLLFRSYGGSTWANAARIELLASDTHTETSRPTHISFQTTPVDGVAVLDRMRIDASGNVGVGTTNPSAAFQGAGVRLGVEAPRAVDLTLLNLTHTGTIVDGDRINIGFDSFSATAVRRTIAQISAVAVSPAGGAIGALAFYTNAGAGALTERMRIDSSGNVGIGTSSPGTPLHISKTTDGGIRTTVGSDGGRVTVNYSDGIHGNRLNASSNYAINTATENLYLQHDYSGHVIAATGGGSLLVGTTTNSSNGRLQLATHTTAAGGIGFGTDVNLYRSAANMLRTDDNFATVNDVSGGTVSVGNTLYLNNAVAAIVKPITSRFEFAGIGGLNSVDPWWYGLHLPPPDVLTVGGANTFPRVSHFFSYTTIANPTDLTYGILLSNSGGTNPSMRLGSLEGTGKIYLTTAGVDRVTIDGSGNVSVGSAANFSDERMMVTSVGDFAAAIRVRSNASASNWARLDIHNVNSGNPAIFAQDAVGNLLIRNDGVGTINFSTTGGTSRLQILNNGNVGISTTGPSALFHVNLPTLATNTVNSLLISRWTRPQTGGVKWGNSFDILLGSYGTSILSQSRVDFKLADGGTDLPDTTVMTLQGNGNVGIGTTSPNFRFESYAGTTNGTTINSRGYLANGAVDTRCGTVRNSFDGNTDFSTFWTAFRGANGSSYKSIFGLSAGSGDVDVMTLVSTGNVGIGTTIPQNKLHVVNGSENTTGDSLTVATLQVTGPNVATTTSNATFIVATNDALGIDIGGSIGFAARYSSTSQFTAAQISGRKEDATSGNFGGYLAFCTRAHGTQLSEKVRITGAGNVGIGTTIPSVRLSFGANSNQTFALYENSGGSNLFGFKFTTGVGTDRISFIANGSEFASILNNGVVLIGTTTDSANGRLQLATHTTAAGGIGFGTDVNLYRSAANTLKTDDDLVVAGTITGNLTGNAATASTLSGASQTLSNIRINFGTAEGNGHPFSTSHYSIGKDYANGGWTSPHYGDLIIGYHTGIRIGASYSGTRFYNNSPTTDANNDGNGDGGESLLMTVGGYVGTASHTDVVVNNNLFANVSMRAPVFYDSNNTGYYLDAASTSNLNSVSMQGGNVYGVMYFHSNQNTTGSAPPLQAYSTNGSGAIMSFHRGGAYAVNFGLDSDNVMRIGGWSASANRWQLDMSGNGTYAGNVTAYSDIRVKDNIRTINNALNKVISIRGVYFTRKDQDDKTKIHTGVIAQEVELVLPEVVSEDNEGKKSVAYGNIVGLLIEAIKEQQQQIEKQQSQIDELKLLVQSITNK